MWVQTVFLYFLVVHAAGIQSCELGSFEATASISVDPRFGCIQVSTRELEVPGMGRSFVQAFACTMLTVGDSAGVRWCTHLTLCHVLLYILTVSLGCGHP